MIFKILGFFHRTFFLLLKINPLEYWKPEYRLENLILFFKKKSIYSYGVTQMLSPLISP